MIATIRKQFAKHPPKRRRQLYTMLWFGIVVWSVSLGTMVWNIFRPGRPLGVRIFTAICVLLVVGVTGAFAWTFHRLDRQGAWDDYMDTT